MVVIKHSLNLKALTSGRKKWNRLMNYVIVRVARRCGKAVASSFFPLYN